MEVFKRAVVVVGVVFGLAFPLPNAAASVSGPALEADPIALETALTLSPPAMGRPASRARLFPVSVILDCPAEGMSEADSRRLPPVRRRAGGRLIVPKLQG